MHYSSHILTFMNICIFSEFKSCKCILFSWHLLHRSCVIKWTMDSTLGVKRLELYIFSFKGRPDSAAMIIILFIFESCICECVYGYFADIIRLFASRSPPLPSTLHLRIPSLNTEESPSSLIGAELPPSVKRDKGKAGVSCRWKVTLMMMMKMMRHFHGGERVINLGNTVGFMAQWRKEKLCGCRLNLTRFNNHLQTSSVCSSLI